MQAFPEKADLEQQLTALTSSAQLLTQLGHGIEKESLRVTCDGQLADTAHPKALGSALRHPHITTDFCEAQPELITGVHPSAAECIAELDDIHRYLHANVGEELLWASSMPCILREDKDIPVGRYGTSNIARAKTVYRLGLGNRYGRLMQTISGIHYNFSLPKAFWPALAAARHEPFTEDYATRCYLDLIRNFRRDSWLLIYLFGASPALCKSFVKDKAHELEDFDNGTLYRPHGTSLRMGRLGYTSDAQTSLHVSYNTLEDYATTIRKGLSTNYPDYERYNGKVEGEYQQLNAALLQIENEFYGTIRPKRTINKGERPLTALLERGVEYVEVRCLDVNPFLPAGIDAIQARFIDLFLLNCLLQPSAPDSLGESETLTRNQLAVVERGREPGLKLERGQEQVAMVDWATELLDGCAQIARFIDQANSTEKNNEKQNDESSFALHCQRKKLENPQLTPSARILAQMRDQSIPFYRFSMNASIAHSGYYADHPLRDARLKQFEDMATNSIKEQEEMEASETETFEEFLEHYLALP